MFETLLVSIIILLVGMVIVYFFCYLNTHHALLLDYLEELKCKVDALLRKIDKPKE